MSKTTSYTLENVLIECRRQHGLGVLILTQVDNGVVSYLPIYKDFKVDEGLKQYNEKAWQAVLDDLKTNYVVITRDGLRTILIDQLGRTKERTYEPGFVIFTLEEPTTLEGIVATLKPTNDLMMLFWLSEVLKCLMAHRERQASLN